MRKELRDKGGVAWCLERFAEIEVETGDPLRAARLLGAAETLRTSLRTEVDIADRPDYERTVSTVRDRLGEQVFATAYEQGKAMSFEQGVAYAQASSEKT